MKWVMTAIFGIMAFTGESPKAAAEEVMVRVLSERAEVRTGPSFTFREIYVARPGEILRVVGRAPKDYWFRVLLPDGTYGWILGDEVLPLEVEPSAPPPPSFGVRFLAAVFSPPPLQTSSVGLSFSAGLLGGEGLVLFRPSVVLAPHLAVEAYVGETVGENTDVFYYGGGANLFLWPSSPVTPFVGLGGGGARARGKVDKVPASQAGNYATANAGGGLLFAFKKRITFRIDLRHHLIFDPNYSRELQEYSGGLVVLF